MIRALTAALLATLALGLAHRASGQPPVRLERFEGPPMSATGSALNEGSTLNRDWFVVHDEAGPVRIDGKTGVEVVFDPRRGRFVYRADYVLKAVEPVVAWEIRYLIVDVFGRVVRTHSSTRVADVAANFARESVGWVICGSPEASRAYSSIAFVASARLASGKIYDIDRAAIVGLARTVADKVADKHLDPERPLILVADCFD